LTTFLSPGIATSVNIQVSFLLLRIMMSDLLLGIVLSVRTCWFHYMVTLPSWVLSTDSGTWSFFVWFYSYFLAYVTMQFSTHSVMSLYVLFFCQYVACSYDVFRCLITLFTESVIVICFCYYYYYYWISHFSASAGKHSPVLGYVMNRNRLGGLICNLKSFLQLNIFLELQIFAFVCTQSDAG
jgi:hypothetical protein